MKELIAQHVGLAWGVVGALAAVITLSLLAVARRRNRRPYGLEPDAGPSQPHPPESYKPPAGLDSAALTAAVRDAETHGQHERLPGLYLSLAWCQLESGGSSDAAELLRKSIRGSASPQHKEVLARARMALGDLAHASGDLTTACEHWQIARALFHELKQGRELEVVEMRMQRNGCPTDWVLTDF